MIPSLTRKALIVGGLLLGCLNGAQGAVTVLDFEGIPNNQLVGDYYNGGAGGDLGVSFYGMRAITSYFLVGGAGGFYHAPAGDTVLGHSGNDDYYIFNVADGFTTGLSFYYETFQENLTLTIYSEIDTGGDLITVINLPMTADPDAPLGAPDHWAVGGIAFDGVARSVRLSNNGGIFIDALTFGSTTPGVQPVPEPSAYAALAGLAVAGFAALRRRRA